MCDGLNENAPPPPPGSGIRTLGPQLVAQSGEVKQPSWKSTTQVGIDRHHFQFTLLHVQGWRCNLPACCCCHVYPWRHASLSWWSPILLELSAQKNFLRKLLLLIFYDSNRKAMNTFCKKLCGHWNSQYSLKRFCSCVGTWSSLHSKYSKDLKVMLN